MSGPGVRILADAVEVAVARRLQARRYIAAGFVKDLDPGEVIDDRWVDVSEYFGVLDGSGSVVGVARLIPGGGPPLPVFTEFELDEAAHDRIGRIERLRMAEVSALAVERGFGAFSGGTVAKSLYRAMFQYSLVEADYSHWVAAIDVRVARHLVRNHGFLFEHIGPPRNYLGSETVPVILDLHAQMRHFALVDTAGGEFFSAGLIVDLTGEEARLVGSTGEFSPERGRLST